MTNALTIRGLPDSIRDDGWWLTPDTVPDPTEGTNEPQPTPAASVPKPVRQGFRHPRAVLMLLALVWLADWLFWDHSVGTSFALFVLALGAAVLTLRPEGTTRREWGRGMGALALCCLPVIEMVQTLSVLFALAGLVGLAAWVAYGRIVAWWQALWLMVRLSSLGTIAFPLDMMRSMQTVKGRTDLTKMASSFVLPIGAGSVFLLLFVTANPILERGVEHFARFDFLTDDQIERAVFWVLIAIVVWPYLNLRAAWVGPVLAAKAPAQTQNATWQSIVNPQSVRNSLILFNLMFLMQTGLDVGVLSGGMALPEGMSYASYAHRGAYPLVATALLAGGFAVITRTMAQADTVLRGLVFLWLAQTLFLVVTAAFRLWIYVDAYALTHLRVAAFIWMALVFCGLVLILVQTLRNLGMGWLMRANLIMLAGTLYLCCFVNFASVIAYANIANLERHGRVDTRYVCRLGPQALPAIHKMEAMTPARTCTHTQRPRYTPKSDIRKWGFRHWRLGVYLDRAALNRDL